MAAELGTEGLVNPPLPIPAPPTFELEAGNGHSASPALAPHTQVSQEQAEEGEGESAVSSQEEEEDGNTRQLLEAQASALNDEAAQTALPSDDDDFYDEVEQVPHCLLLFAQYIAFVCSYTPSRKVKSGCGLPCQYLQQPDLTSPNLTSLT